MRLLSGSALWWLLLGAPIILLYLLKLKRTRHIVSSVLLWRRATVEMQANAPFRKLRRNLLLILQLVILALIVLALSRPAVTSHTLARGSTIIVVDSTASMGARDEDDGRQSRLERARQIVQDMLSGVGPATRAALVVAAGRPRLVCPLSSDRPRLLAALGEIKQTDEAGDLREAVLLARELAKAQQDTDIVVISDGGAAPIDSERGQVRYVRVGRRANNVGIVAMNSAIGPGGRRELFASIANFCDTERTVTAELRINGSLIDVRAVKLGPAPAAGKDFGDAVGLAETDHVSNRRSLIFDSLPPEGGPAELKLDVDDDLAADNIAYATVGPSRLPVVGVASANRFVWQALLGNPDIEAHRIEAGQESNIDQYDVVVSEGDRAASLAKSSRGLLCIDPGDVAGFWSASARRSAPAAPGSISAELAHPVNNYISYAGINFDQRKIFQPAPWLKPIVSDGAGGLIWAGENNGKRTVLLGFNLAETDLPVRMEFPILMANCIEWLAQGARSAGQSTVPEGLAIRTGQAFRIQSQSGQITIRKPDGEAVQCETRDGIATFEATDQAGLYAVKQPSVQFMASLLNSAESDTRPRDSSGSAPPGAQGNAETYTSNREVWIWAAYGALLVLGIEWLVYLRRAFGPGTGFSSWRPW